MTDPIKGTGDGAVPHVTPLQFWSAIIPLIATSVMLPMWQMWLSSQHEVNRQQDARQVLANQDETHKVIKAVETEQVKAVEKAEETATKTDIIHAQTDQILGSLPPVNGKDPRKTE